MSTRPEEMIDRRRFLGFAARTGGVAAAGLLAPSILAACGSSTKAGARSSTTTAAGGASLGTWTYQLGNSWEAEFLGEAVAAQKGYFRQAGFSTVNLVPGSPSTSGETYVATHQGNVSITSGSVETASAVKQGLPVRIVAAHFQKSPQAVVSLAKNPITTPAQLAGKKIGVPPSVQTLFMGFLAANKIDSSSIKVVPISFDPTPLASGEVQALVGYSTNQAVVLDSKGFQTSVMLFNDFGYSQCADGLVVTTDTLQNDRDRLKAFLLADIMGWQTALPNLSSEVSYMVDTYGKTAGLDTSSQLLRAQAEAQLMTSPTTRQNGLFTLTPDEIDQNMNTVAKSGISGLTSDQVFDFSALSEVYDSHPNLKNFSG